MASAFHNAQTLFVGLFSTARCEYVLVAVTDEESAREVRTAVINNTAKMRNDNTK